MSYRAGWLQSTKLLRSNSCRAVIILARCLQRREASREPTNPFVLAEGAQVSQQRPRFVGLALAGKPI